MKGTKNTHAKDSRNTQNEQMVVPFHFNKQKFGIHLRVSYHRNGILSLKLRMESRENNNNKKKILSQKHEQTNTLLR